MWRVMRLLCGRGLRRREGLRVVEDEIVANYAGLVG